MEQHEDNTGPARVQHASNTLVGRSERRSLGGTSFRLSRTPLLRPKADSGGLAPSLRVKQVKHTGNHRDDQDAKYQPKP